MTESQILVLLAPRDRRDDFVDALMSRGELSGFTLLPALGFSREHSHFNVSEQVSGYREFDRFEVITDATALPLLIENLSEMHGRDRLRYWVYPLSDVGHLQATFKGQGDERG
jgi:hypothetical protein